MSSVDEVKSRLNIEDVISEYVPLKRTGSNFKGLSPFSSEKTPSFVVSPEKQIWKDFSSGKGGSMFDFVMEVEGIDFKGALELLARKAGVDLEQYGSAGNNRGPDKERLYQLLELSAKFYQVQFSKQPKALNYVIKERQFNKDTALAWRLGYSPNTGTAIVKFAKAKGFSDAEIKASGLSSGQYSGSPRDMFRGRLMIPLCDAQGRVIGFTARLLDGDPKAPKYINTPQTVLYDKSRHVYGLDLAKESIRKNNFAILVEGNLDVIASHQAGVKEAVATAGTALTEPHLKTLSRLTDDIRISFDSDKAGLAATERAIPLASRAKVSLSVIDIPNGKDPDELIRQDPQLWQDAVSHKKYALDWLMDRYKTLLDVKSAQGKRQFSSILLPIVKSLNDAVERDHYMNIIAQTIDVNRSALEQKLDDTPSLDEPQRHRNIKTTPQAVDKANVELQRLQDRFLSLVMSRTTLRGFIEIVSPEMMVNKEGQELLENLKKQPDVSIDDLNKVQSISDYVKIETLLYEELYQALELNELHDEVARLQADLVTKFVKTEKEKLSHAQRQTTDEVVIRVLQEKDKQYNLLLNQVKGAAHG